jgi:hypothetical protein
MMGSKKDAEKRERVKRPRSKAWNVIMENAPPKK